MSDQLPSGPDQKQQYKALTNEIADILLGPDSPVRGTAEFDELIVEHDRLQSRQAELKTLDAKLVEVLPGLEQAEAQLAVAQKKLEAEKKKLKGFAGELGKAAFAGLRAGELPDHPLFADRKELQTCIESLQGQKAELVTGENAGMLEKAKVQAQQLKLTGQMKIEELKIGSLDRALGTALLTSKEKPPIQCDQTDGVLKAIAEQRKLMAAAKETVEQAETTVAGHQSATAETLGRSTLNNADLLKSELKETRKEHRQNEKAIISGRSSVVTTALEIESLRGDTALGEKLKQLWSLKFDLESSKSQAAKIAEESVARFKRMPARIRYSVLGLTACAVLACLTIVLQGPDNTAQQTASESETAALAEEEALASLESFGANVFQEDTGRVHVEMPVESGDNDLQLLNGIRHLRSLMLPGTKVTDAGLNALVPHETLETLSMANTAVTDAGMQSIGKLKKLKVLDLSKCKISDKGISALFDLRALDHLVLNETSITDVGCKEIVKIHSLTKIFLNTTSITDSGVDELAKLTNLQRLGVGDTRVSNAGLESLTKLKRLEVLGLFDSKVSDSGLKYLEQLLQLKTLELTNSDVSANFGQLWTSRSKIEEMLREVRNPPKSPIATSKRSPSTTRSSATTRSSSNSGGMSDADRFALQLLIGAATAQQQNQQVQAQRDPYSIFSKEMRCRHCAGAGQYRYVDGNGQLIMKDCPTCRGRGKFGQ